MGEFGVTVADNLSVVDLATNAGNDTLSVVDAITHVPIATVAVGTSPNSYGEFIGAGVPRLLKEDALARLEAVKTAIEGSADGVGKPELAIKHIEAALISGDLSLRSYLWSGTNPDEVDPHRLDALPGEMVFWSDETTVEDIIDAIRRGWILDAELRSGLIGFIDEIVRADRVLVAVAIDDAIVAVAESDKIAEAQEILEKGDALVKEAAVWERLDKKFSLLNAGINQYRNAWEAAVDLTE